MKQFFKMFFASTLAFCVAAGIFVFAGFIFTIGLISSVGQSMEASLPKNNENVLKLSLNGSLKEVATNNPFGGLFNASEVLSLKDIVTAIKVAKENGNIKGIYLDASHFAAGMASVDVIRRALQDFKESGKFITAYADDYTQGCYNLCSVADDVFMNPLGILKLSGFASHADFYKGLFKKAGLEMMIFKVGTYKGAVEPFMNDRFSEENREQITSYQQAIWKNVVRNIASGRGISEETVHLYADSGYMFASGEKSVELGFIDELKYREDAENFIKEKVNADLKRELKTVDVKRLVKLDKNTVRSGNKIAIVYAEGEIMSSSVMPIYSSGNFITEKLVDDLIKLKKDDAVKAVVLRVNSPGGSAYISEQIWNQVNQIKKDKTIVVSMGNVAASGGYYISCAADKIISEANTLTGSIGVFSILPNITGLYNKLDIKSDVVKTNKYSDFGDITRPWREDEKQLMQNYTNLMYDTFLTRCAEGRGMTIEQIDAIGQGRVWTGEQALERGLVDETGDLNRAVEAAAELAGLSDYEVKNVTLSTDPITEFLKKQIGDIKSSIVEDCLGEDAELLNTLRRIRQTEGVQARLPYDFEFF
ncbi:MAG: signal peptide peptidase SppA [Tannerella sp.]|jgi:protease-4|nr:signal peptide peptidase SppA [Tannerella sp.]